MMKVIRVNFSECLKLKGYFSCDTEWRQFIFLRGTTLLAFNDGGEIRGGGWFAMGATPNWSYIPKGKERRIVVAKSLHDENYQWWFEMPDHMGFNREAEDNGITHLSEGYTDFFAAQQSALKYYSRFIQGEAE